MGKVVHFGTQLSYYTKHVATHNSIQHNYRNADSPSYLVNEALIIYMHRWSGIPCIPLAFVYSSLVKSWYTKGFFDLSSDVRRLVQFGYLGQAYLLMQGADKHSFVPTGGYFETVLVIRSLGVRSTPVPHRKNGLVLLPILNTHGGTLVPGELKIKSRISIGESNNKHSVSSNN